MLLAHDITSNDMDNVNNVFKEENIADKITNGIKHTIDEVTGAVKEAEDKAGGNIQK